MPCFRAALDSWMFVTLCSEQRLRASADTRPVFRVSPITLWWSRIEATISAML